MVMTERLPVVNEGSIEAPRKVRPPVEPSTLAHRDLRDGEWWQAVPAFAGVDAATFHDHRWQMKNTITKASDLLEKLSGLASEAFLADAAEGFRIAPMAVRVSPYLLSLVDWKNPYEDPIRRQFLPTASSRLPDHPKLTFDSLGEQSDAPVPGLTHRYPDKALFLALDTCPVYCRFCTRSYAVGPDQEMVEKVSLKASPKRWEEMFAYVASRPELEDIVISGGDAWNLRAAQIRELGDRLLSIDHVRRMRFASKGPAVLPQKLLTDDEWVEALVGVVDRGRALGKDVMLHTHFNHANEITEVTRRGLGRLFQAGVFVRNQTVLQRGVNDTEEAQTLLARRLAWINVHPYYVYQHDMVKGTEELRTTVATAERLEKWVRGAAAGFNTPTFVVDAPGGGGKRTVHSYEYYDHLTGISVYSAPSVKPGQLFLYFDPIDLLPEEGRARWAVEAEHGKMIDEALEVAREVMVS
ncbi:MAG: KamA family radical SAM protein [Myxococcales bacterium]|nr:KamA family radical SAM protein [Myxococcales bacterium]